MALFDWNKNGKDDLFDNMMDYALYKETFGKDEEEEEYDFSSEETDFDSEEWDDSDSDNDEFDEPISSTPIDISLQFADSNISTEQLLKRLVDMQKRMYRTFEQFARESGYRAEVTESQQMHKDLWLYSFAKQLEYSNLSKDNKTKLLQTLLDTFGINNLMSAEEYYRVIAGNSKYVAYVSNCLETRPDKCGLFWVLLAEMSGNEGERTSDVLLETGVLSQEQYDEMSNMAVSEYISKEKDDSKAKQHLGEFRELKLISDVLYTEILRQYFINHPQSIDKYTFLQNSAFTHWVKEKCSKMC